MGKLYMGMEGLDRFDDALDHLPGVWRRKVLLEEPNGDTPINGMMSFMETEMTDNYKFHWAEKEFPALGGAVTAVYMNPALSVAYSTAQPAGTLVYAKVSADTAKLFVPGATAQLRMGTDFTSMLAAKVVDVNINGANSRIGLRLYRADGLGTANLTTCTTAGGGRIMRIGSVFADGAQGPEAISRESEWLYNLCQTFRTAVEITGRMLNTTFRTGSKYQERKGDALKDHMRDIEWATMFQEMSETTNDAGKKETTMHGMYPMIRDYCPANILDYRLQTETSMKGKEFIEGGDAFLEKVIEQTTQSGGEDRLVIGGAGCRAALNAMARAHGDWSYTTVTTDYGIKIRRYETSFGSLDFKTHPLFRREPQLRNCAFVIAPKDLRLRPHKGRDTHYKKDPKNPFNNGVNELSGPVDIDAIREEWLTDAGLEMAYVAAGHHAFISGMGEKNVAA